MQLDGDACYRALSARDARFDGLFFVGVTTTGIYCRPVCPARTPGRTRCRFFRLGAQAEQEGFRACFRCRPELAPGGAPVDAVGALTRRAVRRIDDGALDTGSIAALAEELGVSARHLRRAMKRELGVSPVELAQSRRLALAKQLVVDSDLSLSQIAFASGFSSVRRFNAVFKEQLRVAPSSLREKRREPGGGLRLSLAYREPFSFEATLEFLSARAIRGVAEVADGRYRRTVQLGEHQGWIEVSRGRGRALSVELSPSLLPVLAPVAARVRAMFDLDADPVAIARALGSDPQLQAGARANPGLRVPGAFDAFELVVRTVLGQQVSVKGAGTLAARLTERFGEPLETPWPTLSRRSVRAAQLASARLDEVRAIGLPAARAQTLVDLARSFEDGSLRLRHGDDPDEARARLLSHKGVGPWTAEYVAMRGLHDPDAFPAGDLVLRRRLAEPSQAALLRRAEAWRPFRAYAAMTIWRMSS